MKLLRTIGAPIVALVVLLIWLSLFSSKDDPTSANTPPNQANQRQPVNEKKQQAAGAPSCSATACHGNTSAELPLSFTGELAIDRPCDSWKSSYFAWAAHDKHAHAYEVLTYDPENVERDEAGVIRNRSQRIITNLRQHDKSWKNAWEDARCLACHSNPTLADAKSGNLNALSLQKEGVSCEACHGDSSNWRSPHTAWGAKTDRNKAYAETGMTKLYDITTRAQVCVGCHVGAPAEDGIPIRDVNHDLIAAGHPRLNFEFATYSRLMPPHWREKDRSITDPATADQDCKTAHRRKPGFEAEFWAIGQAVQAEAALKLLRARMQESVWPEFAEFNCYACHHGLEPQGWRQKREAGENAAGVLIWNRPTVFTENSATESKQLLDAIKKTQMVGKPLRDLTKPDPAMIDEAIRGWELWRSEGIPKRPLDMLAILPLNAADIQTIDWDQAARMFAAAIAIENGLRDERRRQDPKGKPDNQQSEYYLGEMFKRFDLRYRPEEFEKLPAKFDSPKYHSPGAAKLLLEKWLEALRTTK